MNLKKVIIDSAHILILKDKGAYNYDTSTPFLKMVSYHSWFPPNVKCELSFQYSLSVLEEVKMKFANSNTFWKISYLSLFMLVEDMGK